MVKCDFPNCPTDEAMPFRCDRCDPPKYYCNKHRLPPSHNCLGITDWNQTKSPVTDISIGYKKSGLTKVVGRSGYFSGIDSKRESSIQASTDAIWYSPKTPNDKLKTQTWYSKIKNGIINFYNTHFKKQG